MPPAPPDAGLALVTALPTLDDADPAAFSLVQVAPHLVHIVGADLDTKLVKATD